MIVLQFCLNGLASGNVTRLRIRARKIERGTMTRGDFAKSPTLAAIAVAMMLAIPDAQAQQIMKTGDILTGQLNAMRSRAVKGKRVNTYQVVSEPRRLPPPSGLCNLETGPETFQIVTASDAEAAKLKSFIGKEISLK